MDSHSLPQSTIEYLNNGSGEGDSRESLYQAARHYREAGVDLHLALEELGERAEADGMSISAAESVINGVYRRKVPPRVERFHAKGKNQGHGRTAASLMRHKSAPGALPEPMDDPVRTLLRTAFSPGEFVHIAGIPHEFEDTNQLEGLNILYEDAMDRLEVLNGDPVALPKVDVTGTLVGINPYKSKASNRRNSEVSSLRHVLVEVEGISKEEQWTILEASRLPLTAVIDSGGDSIHGWVRVDAEDRRQYDAAAKAVYQFFDGYSIQGQNKNPSRLSRLPGAPRGERHQQLLGVNMGLPSYQAWKRLQSRDPLVLSWEDIDKAELPKPKLLIEGMLHQGSKMTLGGGSKSMKSWALADLAVSVSTGQEWWGNKTVQGNVLVIDFELDPYFWRERVRAIITDKGGQRPECLDVLPMRGRMADFDMVRRYVMQASETKEYSMIVLDPIYKCLGGRDENAAGDVADLMNEVESLTLETGAAVVIAAHYSKGNQAAKDSLDRISGSGVFARDPDTIMAMTKHEDDGSFTVDTTVRNFEPIKPFVVSWRWPLMHRNRELNPDDIKLPPNERARQPKVTVASFCRELRGIKPMSKEELKDRTMAAFGIGKSKFYEIFKEAESQGMLMSFRGLYQVRGDYENDK